MLLLGTHIHPASGDAANRQQRAAASLRDVSPTRPVNLQFADGERLQEVEGFDTRPVLRQDSCTVTGRSGVRKPIVDELFTRLAEAAVEREVRYFGFANSDIVLTSAAIARILQADRMAYVFARTDLEPVTERQLGTSIYGTDVFVVDARWWLDNRRRFRPYVVGESCWDNVYTAQLLCWAGGILLNREPLAYHEQHEVVWKQSPFAEHNGYLAARDRLYFTRWAIYVHRLERLRADAAGLADETIELRLQDEVFHHWRPGVAGRLLQALRMTKLRATRWAGVS